jgi:preprotein translocase subunit SecD
VLTVTVALIATMFGTGHLKPRLGIDLAGGTSITLTAKSEDGKSVTPANMKTAKAIIDQRVNAFGVSEAEVVQEGPNNLVINIPKGKDANAAAAQVGKTAKLFFRPVLAWAPVTAADGKKDKGPSKAENEDKKDDKKSGKAMSGALTDDKAGDKKADDKKPSSSPSPTKSETPPPATSTTGTVPKNLQQRFDKLTCTDTSAGRAGRGKDSENIVACGNKEDEGGLKKFALGPVAVAGTEIKSASAGMQQSSTQVSSGWQVNLEFNGKGSDQFADITGKLLQQPPPQNQFAIVLDGRVMSDPQVNERITGGRAQISGNFTQKTATDLANILKYGALPLSFDQGDVTEVSSQLGGDQLSGSLIAGGVGVALIVLYTLAYYRGLGLVSIASLFISMALTYAIMTLLGPTIGFALNLPALAGAIVAIGITADSFIVYFERIRDELREGRGLRPAVENSWPKARRTILVSDFVTFLAAASLYAVSVGKVKGFAFTLGLTTLLDLVVVFLFTKPLMTALAKRKFFSEGHKWSGLDPKNLGVRSRRPVRGRRASARRAAEQSGTGNDAKEA